MKKREIQRLKWVYNSYPLATISGLGLYVSSVSNFQDTKMAVIACFMSKRTEFGIVVSVLMEMLREG